MDEKITRINKNPYVGCTVTLLVDYDVHLAAGTRRGGGITSDMVIFGLVYERAGGA
jgi:hypothetical protein